jgi:hypothetical protein
MISQVDWVSFTMPHKTIGEGGGVYDPELAFNNSLAAGFGSLLEALELVDDWTPGGGRAPYTETSHSKMAGMTFFSSSAQPHMLVEITGVGCDFLRHHGILDLLIQRNRDRVTRIDIAVDIETPLDPRLFAQERAGAKFKSTGGFDSVTGITAYVGSYKSERFARVYRYHPPHPRSHLMRVEMVSKGSYAKVVAGVISNGGLLPVTKALGEVYGWQNALWTPLEVETADIKVLYPERHQGGTVRWLLTSVLPAVKRLVDTGEIDSVRLFIDEILEHLGDE